MLGNYFWVDFEATGLNKDKCDPCEYACIITDPYKLDTLSVFTRIINSQEAYWQPVALEMHQQTGLYDQMGKSGLSMRVAAQELENFIVTNQPIVKDKRIPYQIAGSSVWFDRQLLDRMLGESFVREFFSHQMIDVSSIKLEIRATCGDEVANEFLGCSAGLNRAKHRALDDIKHSIGQLKHFRNAGQVGGVMELKSNLEQKRLTAER